MRLPTRLEFLRGWRALRADPQPQQWELEVIGLERNPNPHEFYLRKIRRAPVQSSSSVDCDSRDSMAEIEVSKGIVVNPNRCSGTPLIKGTRIYARIIADGWARHPDPFDTIDNWGLSYEQLANVRYWDKRGRPQ